MNTDINNSNIDLLIRQLNLKEQEMKDKRFSIQILDDRIESLSPFIFDGFNIGTYRCYAIPKYETINLIVYLGFQHKKLNVEIRIDAFGTWPVHNEVAYHIDKALKGNIE